MNVPQMARKMVEIILNGLLFLRGLKNIYNHGTKRHINPYTHQIKR